MPRSSVRGHPRLQRSVTPADGTGSTGRGAARARRTGRRARKQPILGGYRRTNATGADLSPCQQPPRPNHRPQNRPQAPPARLTFSSVVWGGKDDSVGVLSTGGGLVGQNFLAWDRDQELFLPPSLREWLPQDHLAWFVLDAVEGSI